MIEVPSLAHGKPYRGNKALRVVEGSLGWDDLQVRDVRSRALATFDEVYAHNGVRSILRALGLPVSKRTKYEMLCTLLENQANYENYCRLRSQMRIAVIDEEIESDEFQKKKAKAPSGRSGMYLWGEMVLPDPISDLPPPPPPLPSIPPPVDGVSLPLPPSVDGDDAAPPPAPPLPPIPDGVGVGVPAPVVPLPPSGSEVDFSNLAQSYITVYDVKQILYDLGLGKKTTLHRRLGLEPENRAAFPLVVFKSGPPPADDVDVITFTVSSNLREVAYKFPYDFVLSPMQPESPRFGHRSKLYLRAHIIQLLNVFSQCHQVGQVVVTPEMRGRIQEALQEQVGKYKGEVAFESLELPMKRKHERLVEQSLSFEPSYEPPRKRRRTN